MTTGSHVMSVGDGDSLQLDCEFEATSFNLFENPVLWRKTQGAENTQVNMMGNVLPPFVAQRRFAVDFVAKPPSYTLWLHISGKSAALNALLVYCILYVEAVEGGHSTDRRSCSCGSGSGSVSRISAEQLVVESVT